MNPDRIRNFCIIAHVDHGKSTLADRLMQLTDTVAERDMQEQLLDTMDLERERGVTIKASAVRMVFRSSDSQDYLINLIDTPGHVDFGYEVSRALQACEGVLLVVDASQGIEAQTLSNVYLALEQDLEILAVINKVDLPAARPDNVARELEDLLGTPANDMLRISAKRGTGVRELLERAIVEIPPPDGVPDAPLRALVFDSHYDPYKGVVAYVRIVDGRLDKRAVLQLMSTGSRFQPVEIGIFSPTMQTRDGLSAGEVGYIATGFKTVKECRVGDTITSAPQAAPEPLPGYQLAKPMVFAGIYPVNNEDYGDLRDALEKLQLNDASLSFEPETSQALNFGFRVGFLGLFHMEIVQERLEREYDIDILATAPGAEYEVSLLNGQELRVDSPARLPDESTIAEVREPWMKIQIYTPGEFIGAIMELCIRKRAEYETSEFLDGGRVILHFRIPLNEIIIDFYDRLKSVSRGYASLDYQFDDYRAGDLVRLEILVNGEAVDALALIVHREDAYHKGQQLVSKLKRLIPRQMFTVPIQAASGKRIISRANVKALRKDVLAKCYGGDVTRKRKLLERQKRGKKRMKMVGQVELPQEAFMALLSLDDD
ncbi:MAG: translation elongation factor 4 [Anaerolineaceae bacterium]|nr:translation elongation factor 4 [Anaerolineaceae bacterium]MDE0329844.1 translation elongation factor 4 [Anaerolineaceae bacterium]